MNLFDIYSYLKVTAHGEGNPFITFFKSFMGVKWYIKFFWATEDIFENIQG